MIDQPPYDINSVMSRRDAGWFSMPAIGQNVMASPPTVTPGSVSSLSGAVTYPSVTLSGLTIAGVPIDRFSYTRGSIKSSAPSTTPQYDNVTGTIAPLAYNGAFGCSFMHTGNAFELLFTDNSTAWIMLKINDQYVTMTPLAITSAGTGTFYVKYDFGTYATRRVDILGSNVGFLGANVGPSDGLWPAPIRGPRAIVVTDSFGGAASGGAANSFVSALSDGMGWDNAWPSAVGGTGYITGTGSIPNFQQRLDHDVIQYNPDIVIIAGSINDDGQPVADMTTAANSVYSRIRSALPSTLVFAGTHAARGVNTWQANKINVMKAMKAAAAANGVYWANPIEFNLSYGGGMGPVSGYLTDNLTAGRAGTSGILTSLEPSNFANQLRFPSGATVEIGGGVTVERVQVKSSTAGGAGKGLNVFDGTLRYSHSAGEPVTLVGSPYITGTGYSGATTGYGNADIYVGTDGIHPNDVGASALGKTWSSLLRRSVHPQT